MTAKLLALYKKPSDTEAFDEHYFKTHVPLVEKMPGLLDVTLQRIMGSPMGESPYYLLAEMTFDSMESLQAAMGSDEGRAAGKDLMGFAGQLVQMMFTQPINTQAPAEVS